MSLLQWNDKLDVCVDGMNQEHVELIRLMNIVYDANSGGIGRARIGVALNNLVQYTVKHFKNEEAYMKSVEFSGLKSHKYIHKDLLSRVEKYVGDFNSSGSDTLPSDFFEFLKFWLVSHIQGIDMKYGKLAA